MINIFILQTIIFVIAIVNLSLIISLIKLIKYDYEPGAIILIVGYSLLILQYVYTLLPYLYTLSLYFIKFFNKYFI